jgi:hypothetical protein
VLPASANVLVAVIVAGVPLITAWLVTSSNQHAFE